MKFLDIGEVAARTGVRPSALRYYEEIGLISAITRHGLRRQFPPEVVLQLTLISMGKTAGFSLGEIAKMFGKGGMPTFPRAKFREKANELDQQIRRMTALRDTLHHVATCPAPSHLECPTFRRLISVASKRASKRNITR